MISVDCFCIEAIDDFTNSVCSLTHSTGDFRLRELAGVIAKRRDVSLGGAECFSRELEPSNRCTIELADIVMRKIAQLGSCAPDSLDIPFPLA